MKRLILLIASVGWGQDYTFYKGTGSVDTKELSITQKKALVDAQKQLEQAKEKYNLTVRGVKAAYNADNTSTRVSISACNVTATSAEIIDNKWIIIRVENYNNCVLTVEKQVEPIK